MVEVRAQLRHLRASHKKVRLVAHAIKGLDANQALVRLRFIHRSASEPVAKLLKSAIANAEHNNNLNAKDLFVKSIVVNQAAVLKRFKPAAFGSAHSFKKHSCHIVLVLGLKPGASGEKKAAKAKEAKDVKNAPETKDAKGEKPAEKKERANRAKLMPSAGKKKKSKSS